MVSDDWTGLSLLKKMCISYSMYSIPCRAVGFEDKQGAVSDFIQRFLTNAPGGQQQLGALKKELSARFAEVTDSQHAFMLLLKCRQNKDENV